MDDIKTDLSAVPYKAEVLIWVLGGILLLARFLGLAPSQTLPILNVTLENQQLYSRFVAAMLVAATLYLIWEWMHLSHRLYRARLHVGLTILFSCVALWLSYSLIAANTSFADVLPAWYFIFIAVGFLIGLFVSVVAFASLMIRTQVEAKAINLSRVPVATRAVFKMSIPIVIVLMVTYYVLWYFTPMVLQVIGPCLVTFAYLFMLGPRVASLCFSQDKEGDHVPYRKRIVQLKTIIFDPHDYFYFLHKYGKQAAQNVGLPINADSKVIDPQAIQKTIREKFSDTQSQTPINFRVIPLEDIKLLIYHKDDNPKNESPENRGVRIQNLHSKKEALRVLCIPENPKDGNREITIPINLVESYAEEYISAHPDQDNETPRKLLSFAINQAVIKSMSDQYAEHYAEHLLHRAVEHGQEQQVRDILQQKNLDVNERAEAGWTALLMAAAQGYPQIMRLLLDAGANPDMGNVHGITPLMYGARYKNIEVCKLLLESGANPDLKDISGQTALMIATFLGSADVAEMLLKAGANTSIKDRDDMTALDIAYKHKQGKIAEMIRTAAKAAK